MNEITVRNAKPSTISLVFEESNLIALQVLYENE